MNSYLNDLSRLLVNQLSPEEYNNVMQYYTEYFADAGIEKQEEVIKELGTPEELASKIIAEYNNRQEDEVPNQDNSSYYGNVDEIPEVEQGFSYESTETPVQEPLRPRRRLSKGWIALIVVGAIILSLPIIIACVKKTINVVDGVFNNIDVKNQKYKVIDKFDTVYVEASVADVEIVVGEEYAIEYVLGEDAEVEVKDNKLSIVDDSYKTILTSALTDVDDTYVKIYVPEGEVIDIEMAVDVGDIKISGIEFDSINIDTDTGDISIEGDSDGGEIYVAADIGDVTIKGFLACDIEIEADLGKVNITSYYSSDAYTCDIDTDLGDETVSEEGGADLEGNYNIDIVADIGDVNIKFCDN